MVEFLRAKTSTFTNKPMGVIDTRTGGAEVGKAIANLGNNITEMAFKDAVKDQEKLGKDSVLQMPVRDENNDLVIAEQYIEGKEFTVAILGEEALPAIQLVTTHDFYDFDAKYSEGGSKHIIPAKIKPNIYQEILKLSLKAHEVMGCRGVTRSDFRLDDGPMGSGELIWLEVNTQPGMTATSLLPEQAAYAGHSWEELLSWIVEDASCNR